MKQFYLHALKGANRAPSGAIGASRKQHHDDMGAPDSPVLIASVDPHGLIMSDEEADAWAEEIAARWNVYAGEAADDLDALINSYVTMTAETPDRTSPSDNPDMLLIHPDELRQLLRVFTAEIRALDQGE